MRARPADDRASDCSCVFVIFGGNGDLSKRLLLPSFYNLAKSGLLPERFAIVGTGRSKMTDDEFRAKMRAALREHTDSLADGHKPDSAIAEQIISRYRFFSGDMTDRSIFPRLKEYLERTSREVGTSGSMVFYLATPPALFGVIPSHLKQSGLLEETEKAWRRVVIEKPFGHDYASAVELNRKLLDVLQEDQIYRIDHYLGKETVQNILSVRFGNGILEPIWNNHFIDSVQITVAEGLGVEGRGDFYEATGALRDMIPNHLFQIACLIGMEPPNSFAADDVRDEKVKFLKAITPLTPEVVRSNAVRGQYAKGRIDGREVPGYRDEPKVSRNSATETFAGMKFTVDNWRWAGVPFYLQTGKRLRRKLTQAVIEFKPAPMRLFRDTACNLMPDNLLVLQIQPRELVTLLISAKIPGPTICLGQAPLQFDYREAFGKAPETGYETLLYEVMRGDETLFQRADQAEEGWRVVQPILDFWAAEGTRNLPLYPAGSWGPPEAQELLERDGREWMLLQRPEEGKMEAAA